MKVMTCNAGKAINNATLDRHLSYFESTLKRYNITKSVLYLDYLPNKFKRSIGLSNGSMILKDEKQRSWPVEMRDVGSYVYIKHGWSDFCIANDLNEGDSFKFELIEKGNKPIVKFTVSSWKDDLIDEDYKEKCNKYLNFLFSNVASVPRETSICLSIIILAGCRTHRKRSYFEEKLQEGVPSCIETLSRAGIKISVLTGDKMERAINIAYGHIAYVDVPDQQRKKLDDKSEKFIFIGYSQQSKGYKLYNPVDKKIKISRDIIFDEENSWD
ncbi:hypothetical protein RJ639_005932 [Escallonia herrerae]|uniref:TF-B3 domain-containing protein n=1 Tax=Escallonia herrerae TaxID=1293975 RepID=A0AA89ATZ2_9ASTE|nr:hypothetical protein RJ639_005932 [Escallonia herrerae]